MKLQAVSKYSRLFTPANTKRPESVQNVNQTMKHEFLLSNTAGKFIFFINPLCNASKHWQNGSKKRSIYYSKNNKNHKKIQNNNEHQREVMNDERKNQRKDQKANE